MRRRNRAYLLLALVTLVVVLSACTQDPRPEPAPAPESSPSAAVESPTAAPRSTETTARPAARREAAVQPVAPLLIVEMEGATDQERQALRSRIVDGTIWEYCTFPPGDIRVITGTPDVKKVPDGFADVVERWVSDLPPVRAYRCREVPREPSILSDLNFRPVPTELPDGIPGLLVEEIPWKNKS